MQRREIRVFVPDDQISLAIGKGGQNVRLAAKLTGWKIDVRSESAPETLIEGGVAEADEEINDYEENDLSQETLKGDFEEDTELSEKIRNLLKENGYDDEKLKTATKEELLAIKGIGEKSVEKIIDLYQK
jgi:N utilization substance protein A